jgi:hypothetical protein
MKNKMPSLLLYEKICFLKLRPDIILQNFWQVIMYGRGNFCEGVPHFSSEKISTNASIEKIQFRQLEMHSICLAIFRI